MWDTPLETVVVGTTVVAEAVVDLVVSAAVVELVVGAAVVEVTVVGRGVVELTMTGTEVTDTVSGTIWMVKLMLELLIASLKASTIVILSGTCALGIV